MFVFNLVVLNERQLEAAQFELFREHVSETVEGASTAAESGRGDGQVIQLQTQTRLLLEVRHTGRRHNFNRVSSRSTS